MEKKEGREGVPKRREGRREKGTEKKVMEKGGEGKEGAYVGNNVGLPSWPQSGIWIFFPS